MWPNSLCIGGYLPLLYLGMVSFIEMVRCLLVYSNTIYCTWEVNVCVLAQYYSWARVRARVRARG